MAGALTLVSGVSVEPYISVTLGCFRKAYDQFGHKCLACHEYTGEISSQL